MDHRMIDQAVEKVGGKFRFSVLMQKRVRELVKGAAPLVSVDGKFNPMNVALQEIMEDKVAFAESDLEEADILGLKSKKDK